MAVVGLSIIGGAGWQFFNDSGLPLSGGKIYTYAAGTTTPQTSYTTSAGNIAHSNPIVLDAAGRVPGGEIWLAVTQLYKFAIYDAANVLIATYDNIGTNFNISPLLANFTGTGSQVAFTMPTAPVNENATNVYINGVYQQKNTYTVVGTTLTFSQAPPYTATIEVSYV